MGVLIGHPIFTHALGGAYMLLRLELANLVSDKTRNFEGREFRTVKFVAVNGSETSELLMNADPGLDLTKIPFLSPVSIELRISSYVSGYNTKLTIEGLESVKGAKSAA